MEAKAEEALIMTKAEELLKSISLYDLIKLSMVNNEPTESMSKNEQESLEHKGSMKPELQGFFKEALEL